MKFSIIIPSYNSSSFINIPLDSLEAQTFKDFEVLIIDDGSTDQLEKTIKPYLERNKSWKLISKANGNWGSVINYVKNNNLAKGDYITILDSDDYFNKNMLEQVSKRDEEVVVTNIYRRIKDKNHKMKVYFGKERLIEKDAAFTPISTPHGKFYKKSLWTKMIDLREKVSYQDTVLFNDLISKSTSIYFIDKPLATWWYDRPGNSTTINWDIKRATLWLETCIRIINLPYVHNEANTWALMYLWELNRNYKGNSPFKVTVDTTKANFKWLPLGARHLAKTYFMLKTKKFR